jgi:hypothetical protein
MDGDTSGPGETPVTTAEQAARRSDRLRRLAQAGALARAVLIEAAVASSADPARPAAARDTNDSDPELEGLEQELRTACRQCALSAELMESAALRLQLALAAAARG